MKKITAREKAYNYLAEKIINDEIKAGESISEESVASALNISRTPLREVLGQLETEGLLVRIPNRGFFVKEVTLQDIQEVCDLRKMFEVYALQFCIQSIRDEDIRRLRASLEQLESLEEINEYFASDYGFHRALTCFCPNRRMMSFLKIISVQERRFRRMLSAMPDRLERVKEGHLRLLDLVEKRDYEQASAALAEHLDRVRASLEYAYKMHANRALYQQ